MNTLRAALNSAAAIAASALLAAAPAAAQDLDLAALQELDDDRTDIMYEGLTVDALEELDVVREGRRIGEVEEVLGIGEEVVALVVELEHDVPGIGGRDVVVPVGEFELIEGRREAELSLSDEELAALQTWDD